MKQAHGSVKFVTSLFACSMFFSLFVRTFFSILISLALSLFFLYIFYSISSVLEFHFLAARFDLAFPNASVCWIFHLFLSHSCLCFTWWSVGIGDPRCLDAVGIFLPLNKFFLLKRDVIVSESINVVKQPNKYKPRRVWVFRKSNKM